MYDMNEYRICWFSRFGFPGKNICVMCVFSIVSFMFFYWKFVCSKILYKVRIYVWYQRNYWLQGDAFVVKGLAQDRDKPCYNGIFAVLILQVKRNDEEFENGDREV